MAAEARRKPRARARVAARTGDASDATVAVLDAAAARDPATGTLAAGAIDQALTDWALAQGLAVQEAGRWLGPAAAIERRWTLGVRSLLAGFRP